MQKEGASTSFQSDVLSKNLEMCEFAPVHGLPLVTLLDCHPESGIEVSCGAAHSTHKGYGKAKRAKAWKIMQMFPPHTIYRNTTWWIVSGSSVTTTLIMVDLPIPN